MKKFDVFKGRRSKGGQVTKIRSVGLAYYLNKWGYFELKIDGLTPSNYVLLKAEKDMNAEHDYVIYHTISYSGEPKQIGVGYLLKGSNAGLIRTEWDFYDSAHIYLDLSEQERSVA